MKVRIAIACLVVAALGAAIALWSCGRAPRHPEWVYERGSQAVYELGGSAGKTRVLKRIAGPETQIMPQQWLKIRPDGLHVVVTGINIDMGAPLWNMEISYVRVLKKLPSGTWEVLYNESGNDFESAKGDPQRLFELLPTTIDEPEPGGGAWLTIPDDAFLDVLEQAKRGEFQHARETCNRLLARYPDSPLLQLTSLDIAVLQRDDSRVRELLSELRPKLAANPDSFVAGAPEFYDDWLAGWEADRVGKNAAERYNKLFGAGYSQLSPPLQEAHALFASVQPDDAFVSLSATLILTPNVVPIFLLQQVHAKLAHVRADFLLLQGRGNEALDEVEGPVRFAALSMQHGPTQIGDLVGIAVVSINCRSFEHVFLGGFPDLKQLNDAWPRMDRAYKQVCEAAHEPKRWSQLERSRSGFTGAYSRKHHGPEASIRNRVMLARWAVLHSAVAARIRWETASSFPINSNDFWPVLVHGADIDPFSDKDAKLRVAPNAPAGWTVYSIGPDKSDDHAAIDYDPTNGTISSGDLSLVVPRERKYPFPGAVETPPTTRDAILGRYKNGLPPDPFADTRDRSYIVSDSEPAVIWSVGPDTDERTWFTSETVGLEFPRGSGVANAPGNKFFLFKSNTEQPEYDPTNGIVSEGNITLRTGP